jgi:hypothetical protein
MVTPLGCLMRLFAGMVTWMKGDWRSVRRLISAAVSWLSWAPGPAASTAAHSCASLVTGPVKVA